MDRLEIMEAIACEAKKKKIRLTDIADKMDVSINSVSCWLNCRKAPSFERMIELCNLVGLELTIANTKELKKLGAKELTERLLVRFRPQYGKKLDFNDVWLAIGEETDKYIREVKNEQME